MVHHCHFIFDIIQFLLYNNYTYSLHNYVLKFLMFNWRLAFLFFSLLPRPLLFVFPSPFYMTESPAALATVLLDFLKPSNFETTIIWKNFGSWNTVIEPLWRTIVLDPKITELETWTVCYNLWAKNTENLQVQLPLKPLFMWLLFLYLETTCCSMQWFYSEHLESNKWFWNKRDPPTCCIQVSHKHCHILETTSTTITEWKLHALSMTVKLNWKTSKIKQREIANWTFLIFSRNAKFILVFQNVDKNMERPNLSQVSNSKWTAWAEVIRKSYLSCN